jgi:hypothetical protein
VFNMRVVYTGNKILINNPDNYLVNFVFTRIVLVVGVSNLYPAIVVAT